MSMRSFPLGRRGAGAAGVACLAALVAAAATASDAGDEAMRGRPGSDPPEVRPSLPTDSAGQWEELSTLQQQLRRLLQAEQTQRLVQQERLKELALEKKGSERLLATVQGEVRRREEELARKQAELQTVEKELADLKSQRQAPCQAILAYLNTLEESIRGGVPWRKPERLAGISDTRTRASAPDATPAAVLDAVVRQQKNEEAIAKSVEIASSQVESGGKKHSVEVLHLGLIAVIFANEAGSVAGVCIQGADFEQGARAAGAHAAARASILEAIAAAKAPDASPVVEVWIPGVGTEKEQKK